MATSLNGVVVLELNSHNIDEVLSIDLSGVRSTL